MNLRQEIGMMNQDKGKTADLKHTVNRMRCAANLSPIVVAHLARSSAGHSGDMARRTIERPALTTPSDKPAFMNNPG